MEGGEWSNLSSKVGQWKFGDVSSQGIVVVWVWDTGFCCGWFMATFDDHLFGSIAVVEDNDLEGTFFGRMDLL